jgi:hypothetical protein
MTGPFNFVSALQQETTTIPIVMLSGWEPVRLGFITSLAQPGGNITGVAWFDLLPKQMELLKEIVPNLRRVACIAGVPGAAYSHPEVFKIAGPTKRGKCPRIYLAVFLGCRRERLTPARCVRWARC